MTRHDCAKRRSRMSSAKPAFPSCKSWRQPEPRIRCQWKKPRCPDNGGAFCLKSNSLQLVNLPNRIGTDQKSEWKQRVWDKSGPKKSGAPAWDRGAPEGASQMPVSFSHQRVGSSILASLSEAGGNDSPKQQVSPFPLTCHSKRLVSETRPRVPLLHERHQPVSPIAFSYIARKFTVSPP